MMKNGDAGIFPVYYSPKCHEEVLFLQPMIPPKRFDFFPLTGGCLEGLGAFRFFFKQLIALPQTF